MRHHLNHHQKSQIGVANDDLHFFLQIDLARYLFIALLFMIAQKLLKRLVFPINRLRDFRALVKGRVQLTSRILLSYIRKLAEALRLPKLWIIGAMQAKVFKEYIVEIVVVVIAAIHGEQRIISFLSLLLCSLRLRWGLKSGRSTRSERYDVFRYGWLKVARLSFHFSNCGFKSGSYDSLAFMFAP